MIQEAYCSFEVAKLLKEKGFEGFTMFSYSNRGTTMCGHWENEIDWLPKCTHQMAMKWLREVHNIFIELRAGETNGKTWYDFDIIPINGREIAWNHYNNLPFVECNSYEEACEEALKYTLENLI